ncbi:MAG: hypothetical protein ACRDF9_10920 [Candidatus Limnocylindria bacterium]|jgi:hypothetical protein
MEQNTSALPSVETVVAPESDSERLTRLTQQLAEDARPLAERLHAVPDRARPLLESARGPVMDFMSASAEQMRPLMNDLRPVASDLNALLIELVARINGAASRLAERLDLHPPRSLAVIVGASTRRLAGVRLPAARPTLSLPLAIRAPRVAPTLRVPHIRLRFGLPLGAVARRLRPGRWALRTVVIGTLVFAGVNPTVRDAVVEQVNSAASFVQTIEIPTIQLPAIELPTIQIPTIEIPKFEIPAFQLPTFGSTAVQPKLAPATFELPPLDSYRAAFELQAAYPAAAPNGTVEWVVALRNTGSVGWYRGVAGAQAALALVDGTEVAVQTTEYVAPGQVGWFVARFRAPAGPGTHTVALLPRIDGRGELPDLGIFALVTVR